MVTKVTKGNDLVSKVTKVTMGYYLGVLLTAVPDNPIMGKQAVGGAWSDFRKEG